jgi:hypothetical protein
MTITPYKSVDRSITMPNEIASWPAFITNILTEQLGGNLPSSINVQFKKISEESLTAIGSAGISVNGAAVSFPVIIVAGKMYPLDVAVDGSGNRFPWHPFFVSLIPSDQLSVISKKGCDLFTNQRAQTKFVRKIIKLLKPEGFREILKAGCQDSRIIAGLIRNNGKDVIDKMLERNSVKRVIQKTVINNSRIIPELNKEAGDVCGPAYVITSDGVKTAVGFNIIDSSQSIVLTSDRHVLYSQKLISEKCDAVKLASDAPSGHGIFYGVYKRKYYSTPPLTVVCKSGNDYHCMNNLGNSIIVKCGSDIKRANNVYFIPDAWKFSNIRDSLQPGDHIKIAFDASKIEKRGLAYYIDGERMATGRSAAVEYISDFYKNAEEIIKFASEYGAVYINKMLQPRSIPIRCSPLIDDFVKIASIVPNQYSAAAILDIGLPINESVSQLKKHIMVYQAAAAALANDVLFSRLVGNEVEADLTIAMHTLCDAGMKAVGILRGMTADNGRSKS